MNSKLVLAIPAFCGAPASIGHVIDVLLTDAQVHPELIGKAVSCGEPTHQSYSADGTTSGHEGGPLGWMGTYRLEKDGRICWKARGDARCFRYYRRDGQLGARRTDPGSARYIDPVTVAAMHGSVAPQHHHRKHEHRSAKDMRKDRAFLPVVGFVVASLIAPTVGVQAQSPQRGPQSIEIAGVRLGMPREEAIKALMANQPPLELSDRGPTQVKVPVLSPDAFVWSMEFEAKRETRDTPFEKMELDFAPPPSSSTVVTLRRTMSFDIAEAKSRAPTAANFLDTVDKRFGPNASDVKRGEVSAGRHQSRTYVWSRAGALLTEQEYQQRWKHYSLVCEVFIRSARSENGIDFRAFEGLRRRNAIDSCAAVATVSWEQDENRIIKRFSITMTDAAAILEAFTKAAEIIEEKNNQQRNQDLDRATKNRTKL